MLEQEGIYNDLSPKLREKLEKRLESFGKTVTYKFNLGRRNPDPQKYNGETIYPSMYVLHPMQWKITDNDEDRKDKQKVKNIGVIESVKENDKGGKEYRFQRVIVKDIDKGKKSFDMTNPDDYNMVMALEMHPKIKGSMFPNNQVVTIGERIDETKLATQQREERSARKKALDAAEAMSDKEIVEFADAMATDEWDSSQDILLLRNKVEEMAEQRPTMFNDLISSKRMKIQATVKRAIDNRTISYNPAEGSLSWTSTQQTFVVLGTGTGDKNDVERFAEWFLTNGKKADDILKKISSLAEKPTEISF
ncbi:MAG: hypothetical protein KGI27_13300 [Thaumarchaeota archaeon]|nr:hypothetical protein [Nitrososphaerota archaeon]